MGRSQWRNRQEARRNLQSLLREGNVVEVVRGESMDRASKACTWNTQRGTVKDHESGMVRQMKTVLKGDLG